MIDNTDKPRLDSKAVAALLRAIATDLSLHWECQMVYARVGVHVLTLKTLADELAD